MFSFAFVLPELREEVCSFLGRFLVIFLRDFLLT